MRSAKIWVAVALVVLVVGLVAGCSSGVVAGGQGAGTKTNASASPTASLVQSSEGGSVTIQLTWLNQQKTAVVFDVSMDTHSVDLDRIDLGKLATLKDDGGTTYQATSWNAPAGGHHRSGTLTFPTFPLLEQGQTKYFEVVIKDVAGVPERVLRWQLTQ